MRCERIARRLGWFLLASGLIGFFGSALCCLWLTQRVPSSIELPLGDISSIAVDSKGQIYCASQGYSRIQQYNASGKFMRGWWVDASGGSFMLTIDSNDLIHVGTVRTQLHLVYNTAGRLVRTEESDSFFETLDSGQPLIWKTKDRTIYKAKTPNLYPRIVKITKSGNETTVVSLPIIFWLVSGPLQGWLRVALGIALLGATEKEKEQKR